MVKSETLPGEKVIAEVSPHPLAFSALTVFWTYVFAVGLVGLIYREQITEWANTMPIFGPFIGPYAPYLVVSILILVPALIYALIKIMWRYLIISFLITVVPPIIYPLIGGEMWWTFPTLMAVGLIAIIGIDLHRRAHKYIITDRRIIFLYNGLFKKTRRDIIYSRISDLIMEKSFLGKIFNFGNIIPISQASMGMGEDLSALTVGGGVGGKGVGVGGAVTGARGVNVPRSRSFYILYGVPRPEKIYDAIIEGFKSSEEAPYLKKILEKMEEGRKL